MGDTKGLIPELHKDIINSFKNEFQEIEHVGDYEELDDDEEDLPLPSIWINLADFTPAKPVGSGFFNVTASFEAYVIFKKDASSKMKIRDFALKAAKFINKNDWGNSDIFGKAVFKFAQPDKFSIPLDNAIVWRIDWEQEAII